jgi:hypothetical protein
MKKAVTIRIEESTRERITNLSTVDDTLDSLINTALYCLERRRRRCGMILEGGIVS